MRAVALFYNLVSSVTSLRQLGSPICCFIQSYNLFEIHDNCLASHTYAAEKELSILADLLDN